MKKDLIKIGEGKETIDLERLIETRMLIQANSGGGKSWLIRRLLEQTHGKVQQIVLDPEGEFGTLREKYDYILAGKGGDTPAEPRSAALLARKLLELKTSAIIDLYELQPQERKRFVRLFLEAMVNAPKELYHEVLVVIDEAHVFVPQVGESEAAGAVIDLATRGRKRGFCAVLATQRISKLHKDAAAECNNKLIGRTSQDIDMKRAADELGFASRDQIFSLRTLKPGEFYAFGPAISDEVKTTKVGPVETSHPKAGSRMLGKVVPPTAGIRKILGALADLPKEAEEEARTIADLRKELAIAKRAKPPVAVDRKEIDRKITAAVKEAERKKDLQYFAERDEWIRHMDTLFKLLEQIGKAALDFKKTVNRRKPLPPPAFLAKTEISKETLEKIRPAGVIKVPNPYLPKPAPVDGTTIEITGPAQKILNAIAWLNTIGVDQPSKVAVAFVSGYSSTSSNYVKTCGMLRTQGLVSYPAGGTIELTEAGREVAHVQDPPSSNEDLHERIYAVLPAPDRKILTPIIAAAGEPVSKAEAAEASGYSETSSNFVKILGKLRTLGLIEYPTPGFVRAAEILFPL